MKVGATLLVMLGLSGSGAFQGAVDRLAGPGIVKYEMTPARYSSPSLWDKLYDGYIDPFVKNKSCEKEEYIRRRDIYRSLNEILKKRHGKDTVFEILEDDIHGSHQAADVATVASQLFSLMACQVTPPEIVSLCDLNASLPYGQTRENKIKHLPVTAAFGFCSAAVNIFSQDEISLVEFYRTFFSFYFRHKEDYWNCGQDFCSRSNFLKAIDGVGSLNHPYATSIYCSVLFESNPSIEPSYSQILLAHKKASALHGQYREAEIAECAGISAVRIIAIAEDNNNYDSLLRAKSWLELAHAGGIDQSRNLSIVNDMIYQERNRVNQDKRNIPAELAIEGALRTGACLLFKDNSTIWECAKSSVIDMAIDGAVKSTTK